MCILILVLKRLFSPFLPPGESYPSLKSQVSHLAQEAAGWMDEDLPTPSCRVRLFLPRSHEGLCSPLCHICQHLRCSCSQARNGDMSLPVHSRCSQPSWLQSPDAAQNPSQHSTRQPHSADGSLHTIWGLCDVPQSRLHFSSLWATYYPLNCRMNNRWLFFFLWDGVSYYFITCWYFNLMLGERVCVSCSVVSDSLQPYGLQPTRLLCPWNSPGKNTGVGCCSLLHMLGVC